MISLGNMREAIMRRPGQHRGKSQQYVPDPEYYEYWDHLAQYIKDHIEIRNPLGDTEMIVNPYFGNFGMRFHPSRFVPNYFHIGIDLTAPLRTPVYPLINGILEYSGFGIANGNYVMLSHPSVKTEDGFILHTLYMHLRSTSVGFSAYQKMLREISLHTYPQIALGSSIKIGEVGESGNSEGRHAHLHLQCEFRHKDGTIVAIDPAFLLGIPQQKNITANIQSPEELVELYEQHKDEINKHQIERYWNFLS